MFKTKFFIKIIEQKINANLVSNHSISLFIYLSLANFFLLFFFLSHQNYVLFFSILGKFFYIKIYILSLLLFLIFYFFYSSEVKYYKKLDFNWTLLEEIYHVIFFITSLLSIFFVVAAYFLYFDNLNFFFFWDLLTVILTLFLKLFFCFYLQIKFLEFLYNR